MATVNYTINSPCMKKHPHDDIELKPIRKADIAAGRAIRRYRDAAGAVIRVVHAAALTAVVQN
jgi:hypothetical protein